MDLARRAFLQFAAGAVGGSLLSPLPWQLAADSARWSQNWSWRPSPERGEITKAPGICTMCEGGCAIQAHLVNGNRAILIEGNPENPLTGGRYLRPWRIRAAVFIRSLPHFKAHEADKEPWRRVRLCSRSHGMKRWARLERSWAICARRADSA